MTVTLTVNVSLKMLQEKETDQTVRQRLKHVQHPHLFLSRAQINISVADTDNKIYWSIEFLSSFLMNKRLTHLHDSFPTPFTLCLTVDQGVGLH